MVAVCIGDVDGEEDVGIASLSSKARPDVHVAPSGCICRGRRRRKWVVGTGGLDGIGTVYESVHSRTKSGSHGTVPPQLQYADVPPLATMAAQPGTPFVPGTIVGAALVMIGWIPDSGRVMYAQFASVGPEVVDSVVYVESSPQLHQLVGLNHAAPSAKQLGVVWSTVCAILEVFTGLEPVGDPGTLLPVP